MNCDYDRCQAANCCAGRGGTAGPGLGSSVRLGALDSDCLHGDTANMSRPGHEQPGRRPHQSPVEHPRIVTVVLLKIISWWAKASPFCILREHGSDRTKIIVRSCKIFKAVFGKDHILIGPTNSSRSNILGPRPEFPGRPLLVLSTDIFSERSA